MTVTLEISNQLAERLRTLASQRSLSVKALGEQALTIGLSALAGAAEASE